MLNILRTFDAKTAGSKTYILAAFGVLYLILKVVFGDATLEEVLPELLLFITQGTLGAKVDRASKE